MTDDAIVALRATSHPVRLRILSLLTASALTDSEIADELGLARADVGYHLHQLLDGGMLEVVPASGGSGANRYRHVWDRERRVARDGETREAWVRAMTAELVRRVAHSSETRGHFTDAELWVTPEEYAEVRSAMRECAVRLHAAARPPRSAGTVKVALTSALFEMEPDVAPVTLADPAS